MTFPRRGVFVFTVTVTIITCISLFGWNNPSEARILRRPAAEEKKTGTPVSEALAHYLMGSLYDNAGQTGEAIGEYRKALALYPDSPETKLRLGSSLLLAGELSEAGKVIDEAIVDDPENVAAYMLRAFVHTAKKEFPEARENYQHVLQVDPSNMRALTFLADLLVQENKVEEALSVYERIVELDSREPFAHFNLGILYGKAGRFADAERVLKTAIDLDDEYVEARLLLGFLYEVDDRTPEAIELYESVTAIDEENFEAHIRLVQVYRKKGLYDKALEANRKVIELRPFALEPYLVSYSIYVGTGRYEEAEEILIEALERGFDLGVVHAGLGQMASRRGDHESALDHYQNAIRQSPGNDIYRFYMAVSLDSVGRREEAIEVLEEVVEEGTKHPEIFNYLGYTYAEEGIELDRAVELVKKALAIDPENAAYIDSLGWAYYKQGRLEEALEQLLRAVERLPDDATVRDHLGDVYYALGEKEKALVEWKRALEIDPDDQEIAEKIESVKN